MVFPTHHHHLIETQCCNVLQCSNSFKRGVRFPPSFGGLARLPGTQVPIRSASQTSSAARIRRASTTRASGARSASSGKDATASRVSACTEALLPYICAPVTRRATMATLSSALPSKIVPLLLGPLSHRDVLLPTRLVGRPRFGIAPVLVGMGLEAGLGLLQRPRSKSIYLPCRR